MRGMTLLCSELFRNSAVGVALNFPSFNARAVVMRGKGRRNISTVSPLYFLLFSPSLYSALTCMPPERTWTWDENRVHKCNCTTSTRPLHHPNQVYRNPNHLLGRFSFITLVGQLEENLGKGKRGL